MPLKPLDPVLQESLCPGWSIGAVESGRSPEGLKANFMLSNGVPQHYRTLLTGDTDAQEALAQIYADKTGQDIDTILHALLAFIVKVESATRARDAKRSPTPKDQEYEHDGDGLWLVKQFAQGSERQQLTNFGATITADIVEDDGTPETKRFFELEAQHGSTYATVRVSAKEFDAMGWVSETLGAKARLYPQPYMKEHTAAAIKDLSDSIDCRHTYVHTGWRSLHGHWHYLHGAGAITAAGEADDVLVSLSETLARYQLPAPPTGKDLQTALSVSLTLRHVAPHHLMIPIQANAYLAPLRTLLAGEPPDVTTWVVGPSGQFKSEYTALALGHYGDFTRLTLPASFTATGNGLERLCHALQDCLLVVDDFYPAGDRRQAEAMNQTAGRLLRAIGNQSSRQRMRQDTSMRSELPPRCMALATGERLPQGHSTNARIFLVTVPKLKDETRKIWAQKLSRTQERRHHLPLAMAGYLQWLATHWERLRQEVPARFHALRDAAYVEGSHTREPSQVAYLELGWDMFTQCAVDAGALPPTQRTRLLAIVHQVLLGTASEHAHVLEEETTISRFLALLRDGFACKDIYLRTPDDEPPAQPTRWGWTGEPHYDRASGADVLVAHPKQALLIGYLDTEYLYLIPEATFRYLQQASQQANRTWPVDNTTLQRELDDAGLIRVKQDKKQVHRQVLKKINGQPGRYLWLKRGALQLADDAQHETPSSEQPPFELEPDDDIPF
jgi:hypothetical protein